MPTNSRKRARFWHAVTAVALAAGAVFLTRGPRTEAGGMPFECGGRQVALVPGDEGALLTAGSLVFELHHISTAFGARYHAPEDSSGTFFWEKEGMATVAVQGDTYPVCRRIR
jgi:hypothetical protein